MRLGKGPSTLTTQAYLVDSPTGPHRTLGTMGSLVLGCWGGCSDLQGLWAQGPGAEDTCGLRAWLA